MLARAMSNALEAPVLRAIEDKIRGAITDAKVRAQGGGGHYVVEVISPIFAGKNTLQRHRLVLGAIAPLMSGDAAPVHAVDTIVAKTPDEA